MSGDTDEIEYEHSTDLFRTDEPMHFCMRPCSERARLKGVIEHGGGTISAKYFGNNSIKLVPPDCQVFEGVCYSSQYVWDCVAANKLLDMKKYKRVEKVAEEMSDDCDDGPSANVRTKARFIRKRSEYAIADDLEILRHILKIGQFANMMGNAMWKSMEEMKITSKPRSWQSMRERFKRKILPSINSYPLTKEEIQLFKKRTNHCLVATDELKPSKWYTFKEDTQIVKYVIDHRFFEDLKGNQVWQRMEDNGVTGHSWQSMKERFRKKIVHNLHNFMIPPTPRKWLENAFGVENSSPEASDRMSREATPDSTVSSPRKRSRIVEHDGWLTKEKASEKEKNLIGGRNKRLLRIVSSDEEIVPPSSKRPLYSLGADQPSTSGQGSKADRQKKTEKTNFPNHQAGGTKGMPGGRRFVTLDSPSESDSPSSPPRVKEVAVAAKEKAGMRRLAPTKIVPLLLHVTPEPQVDRGKALFKLRPPPESCEIFDEVPPLSRPNCSSTSLNLPKVNVQKKSSRKVVVSISAASNGDATERLNVNEADQEKMRSYVSLPHLPSDNEVISKCDNQFSAEEDNGDLRASDSPLIGPSHFGRRLLGLGSPLTKTGSSLKLLIGDRRLSLSASSQDDVVRPATSAAANDLDGIKRITCTEPVTSTKVQSPLPELDATVPSPITEPLPLTTVMPVGPINMPPKTSLEVSNEVICVDDHLSLTSSSQDDVVRPATSAAANDLDGIKRITCTEPVTSTKVQSPLPELDTTVPSPITEPLPLTTVMYVEPTRNLAKTTLEESSEVTSDHDYLSLSLSSQEDSVVRTAPFAAPKDRSLDGIKRIAEPVTSTKLPSPIPELATTLPCPITEPLPLTIVMPVESTRKPPKTTLEDSSEVTSVDEYLSLSSSSQEDSVVRTATFAAAKDLDGIKRIPALVTSTKLPSPIPELVTTVPSPITEPHSLTAVVPVEPTRKPPKTTLEEPNEGTRVDDHLSLSSSSQEDSVVRPVIFAAKLDGIKPIIEPFTSTRVSSPILAERLVLTPACVEASRLSKTTFEESDQANSIDITFGEICEEEHQQLELQRREPADEPIKIGFFDFESEGSLEQTMVVSVDGICNGQIEAPMDLTFRRDEEPNAAVVAAATLDGTEHGEEREEEVMSHFKCLENGFQEPTSATAHYDDDGEEDRARSNVEFAEERLRVMVEEEKEMEVEVEENENDDSVVGKAVSQSLDFPILRKLGEELEKDINSWIERSESNASSQTDDCFTENSDDNERTTNKEGDEAEERLQGRVENSSQSSMSVELNVPEVNVRTPPLEQPCLCQCLCHNCGDTDSDAAEMPDIPEADDRPEGLKKLLEGCQELSSKDGVAILMWSAYKLGMSKKDLVKYYRSIIAHDFDTHLESIYETE